MLKQKHPKYILLTLLTVFFTCLLTSASLPQKHLTSINSPPASLIPGMGTLHHPVSTNNADAQRFFDQGLTAIYAFNPDEAARSFKRAAELDPQLAMAYWGIALALGPNINTGVDPAKEKAAYEAIHKALSLASTPENERAYIEALAKRYAIKPTDAEQLAVDYKNAMGELVKRYPNDLDAVTLYAESAMDLRPWHLWTKGEPAPGTVEIIGLLESVLKRDPDHIGANHYYIHAVEASPHPEVALASAQRLRTLVPASEHLVHMPAHIFMRIGDYEAAARSNEEAVRVDQAYRKRSAQQRFYPSTYYGHDLNFLIAAYMMEGQFKDAKTAATQLDAYLGPQSEMPTSIPVLLRFHRWEDILKLPQPAAKMTIAKSWWHFARGMANAATSRIKQAEAEQTSLVKLTKSSSSDDRSTWKIAQLLLEAKIAIAKQDYKSAITPLQQAVAVQDNLDYAEPPAWFFPVRESLGGTLLLNQNYPAAAAVFQADLKHNPHNGRSLFGLLESLKAQGADTQQTQKEFETAWKNADTQLHAKDL